jgi:hypothetical protein
VQQPLGQEVASHTHWPVVLLHSCPEGHPAHVAPPAPHDVFDSFARVSQVPAPMQQPEHPLLPQEHCPLLHVSPVPHALQEAPPVPHWEADCDPYRTQELPLQQPPEQELPLHTHWPLALQACPPRQAWQLAPPVPHDCAVSEE